VKLVIGAAIHLAGFLDPGSTMFGKRQQLAVWQSFAFYVSCGQNNQMFAVPTKTLPPSSLLK
jgi:hypothetical protein